MTGGLILDKSKKWKWRTKEGEFIFVSELDDNHLRNIALFLMGMGFTKCIASDKDRIMWLTALRVEWERRLASRTYGGKSLARWRASIMEMESFDE